MPTLSAAGKEAFDRLLARAAEEKIVPNFVFGATNLDDELYFRGSGTHVFDDPASGELTPDSIFWICSQTKFIAAVAVLQLVEQGKLSLDTPVSDYIPDFKNVRVTSSVQPLNFKPTETNVTLMHVLNHSSGLCYGWEIPMELRILPKPYTSLQDGVGDAAGHFLDKIKEGRPWIPLAFEPGTNFVYGWSSDIAGFIVEKISGQNLEEYCKKNIFEPLGMKSSFYLTSELKAHTVAMSFREADGKLVRYVNQTPLIEQDPSKVHLHFGGCGLYSSLRDYLTLLRHLLQVQAGRLVSSPILKAATVNTLFVPTLTEEGCKSLSALIMQPGLSWSTGCAVTMADWPGRRRKGTGFWSGWANTFYFLDPTTGVAAVFGTQICGPFDAETYKLWSEFEEALYAGLEPSKSYP